MSNAIADQQQSGDRSILVLTDSYQVIDTLGSYEVKDVAKLLAHERMIHNHSKNLNFSIKDSVIWIAFQPNLRTQSEEYYLSPGNESTVWRASLFKKDTSCVYIKIFEYDHSKSVTNKYITLPFRTLAIPFSSNANDEFILRLAAKRHRNYSLKIGNITVMTNYLIQKELFPVAFIAFMICIFIYNVFLLVSTKDVVFVPYLIYLLFVTFAVPFHSGYVLFNREWMWQGSPFYTVWTSVGYLTAAIFAILYLELKKSSPKLKIWIIFLASILVVIVPLLDFSGMFHVGIMAIIVSTTSFIFNLSLWISGLYVWYKGQASAKFYVIGWLFVFSSMVLFILSTNGLIPYTNFVEHSFYFGFAFEAVLFAFALGDRMNVLKREKQAMELEHLGYIKEQNRLLAKQSFMNSHMLRAPLSRIMGLINLHKMSNTTKEKDDLLVHVENSTHEMDDIAKKMSSMLESNSHLDQYQHDFEEIKQSIYKELNANKSSKS